MKLILPLSEIAEGYEDAVGGKTFALSRIIWRWRRVPEVLCVSTLAYGDTQRRLASISV